MGGRFPTSGKSRLAFRDWALLRVENAFELQPRINRRSRLASLTVTLSRNEELATQSSHTLRRTFEVSDGRSGPFAALTGSALSFCIRETPRFVADLRQIDLSHLKI